MKWRLGGTKYKYNIIICLKIIIVIVINTNCQSNTNKLKNENKKDKTLENGTNLFLNQPILIDTSINLFNDTSLFINFIKFEIINNEQYNSYIRVFKNANGFKTELYVDSFFSMGVNKDILQFQDFNNDKVKDILIFRYSGSHSNAVYNLYLVDNKKKKLFNVNNFEKLQNPEFDSTNNLIISKTYTSSVLHTFYKINSKNELVNLKHTFNWTIFNTKHQYDSVYKLVINRKKLLPT